MTLQQMEQMFANMRAQTKWDVDGEMLWGYFFTDSDTNKLERASQRLTASGYRLVKIYPTDDKSTCVLHVERIEKHTPQTLHARNGEFEKLASELGLESYDGMDVGPVLTK
jgi:Regulator of ribonuclease activity B